MEVMLKEDEISLIKEKLGFINMEAEESEKFKKMNRKKSEDYVVFAKLVIYVHDALTQMQSKLDPKAEYFQQFIKYLDRLETSTNLNNLRAILFDYGNGDNIGDKMIAEEVKLNIISNLKVYSEMIRLYSKLIEETI